LGLKVEIWQNHILIINYGNTSHITNQASHSIGESRRFCWAIVRPEQNNHERMISSSATRQYYHDGLALIGWDAKFQAQNLPGLVTLRA
jgi:hypothetical protein